MTLNRLYEIAQKNDIVVHNFALGSLKSISMPGNVGIDIKELETSSEEKTCVAHEIGHCIKGAFYTGTSPLELKSKCEYKANKWAVKTLIPFKEFIFALENGYTEKYQLAEYFEVTEDFIQTTYNQYKDRIIEYEKNN